MIISSCGNSANSTADNSVSNNSEPDEYAVLFHSNKESQIMAEDLSGKVIVISEKDFIERITDLENPKGFQYKGQTPCVVQIFAYWCTPCTYQSNLLSMMAPEYQGKVIFYKIDIDKAYGVKSAFKVEDVPVMLFFKPRGEISKTVGLLNREKLTNMIEEFLLNP
jgi:thioredoxin-like negative regulator of GroEL